MFLGKKIPEILLFFLCLVYTRGESRGNTWFYFPLPMAINSKKKEKRILLCIFFLKLSLIPKCIILALVFQLENMQVTKIPGTRSAI